MGEVVKPKSIVLRIMRSIRREKRMPLLKPSRVPVNGPNANTTSPGVKKKWNRIVTTTRIKNGINPFIIFRGGSFEKKKGNTTIPPRKLYARKFCS